jgi:hypothetical protein
MKKINNDVIESKFILRKLSFPSPTALPSAHPLLNEFTFLIMEAALLGKIFFESVTRNSKARKAQACRFLSPEYAPTFSAALPTFLGTDSAERGPNLIRDCEFRPTREKRGARALQTYS